LYKPENLYYNRNKKYQNILNNHIKEEVMKLGNLSEKYYTAAEARKMLGLDEEAFQYWGRTERISRIYLPGRKQPVYSKNEINRMATQITAAVLAEQPDNITFRRAAIEDIEQEAKLAHLVFGERAEAIEERKAFLAKNPSSDYHVYDQDTLVSYMNIVPLKHETIQTFMEGRIMAWKINPDDIEDFIPKRPLELLIIDMITTPIVPPSRRAFYGSRLLSGLIKTLTEMGRNGIEIAKIYATSDTTDGIRILKKAGFQVVHESRKGRLSFELDIANSNEKILAEYKDNLAIWKAKNQ
jgi:hypothetical protein